MATKKKLLQAAAGTAAAGAAGGLNVEDVFSTYVFTGNNSTQTITNGIDLSGEGGLVWTKSRGAAEHPNLYDTERGVYKILRTTLTNAESTNTNSLTAFNTDGFTLGTGDNANYGTYDAVSWTFRKAPKFFDVVTYTGTGPASAANEQQVSHNLGVKPAVVIIKRTSDTGDWWVFTDVIDGSNDYGYLNQTAAFGNSANNVPTDSVFNVGGVLNVSGDTYVAYLFAHNDGDGEFGPTGDQDIIKCGSYTGTGSSNFIDLGFEPQWILVKRSSGTAAWELYDNMRGLSGGHVNMLSPSSSSAEVDTAASETFSPNPTGMTIEGGNFSTNYSGSTYIYIAIRRGPMAVPTDATDVFGIDSNTGQTGMQTGVLNDMGIAGSISSTDKWYIGSRLTQGLYLQTNTTAAEPSSGASPIWNFDSMDSFFNGTTWNGYIGYGWKRAPNYFDVVAYTGNGTAGLTVSHNLGVAPEMMWVKCRSSIDNWAVYHKDLGPAKVIRLNNDLAPSATTTRFNNVDPTDSVFTLGTDGEVNGSGSTYIAYLFASVDGVSKVGSYTGTGSSIQNIDCGFTAGSAFVMIKRTDTTGDWIVYDVERGITVNTSDGVLKLNTTDAEATENTLFGGNRMIPRTYGFAVVESDLNASGGSYIFYAISA